MYYGYREGALGVMSICCRQSKWGKPTSGLYTPIPFPFLKMSSPGTGEVRAAAAHPGHPPLRVLLPSGICSRGGVEGLKRPGKKFGPRLVLTEVADVKVKSWVESE